jgi:hypothetical protein
MTRENRCKFLSGVNLLVCRAETVYVPSNREFNEYCLSYAHTVCPLYLGHIDRHVPELREEHCLKAS